MWQHSAALCVEPPCDKTFGHRCIQTPCLPPPVRRPPRTAAEERRVTPTSSTSSATLPQEALLLLVALTVLAQYRLESQLDSSCFHQDTLRWNIKPLSWTELLRPLKDHWCGNGSCLMVIFMSLSCLWAFSLQWRSFLLFGISFFLSKITIGSSPALTPIIIVLLISSKCACLCVRLHLKTEQQIATGGRKQSHSNEHLPILNPNPYTNFNPNPTLP